MNIQKNIFTSHNIACVNWPDQFPSRPDVRFDIAHTGDKIVLKYFVAEPFTLAKITEDNGRVWTDSCVEFFIAFDDSGYYNLECTCTGRALLGFRKTHDDASHAPQSVLDTIVRRPSLGTALFDERRDLSWSIEIELPVAAFFRHDITDISGVSARGNFFKCGDNLSVPHFLSWSPISSPKPNFHLPQFFADLQFEK